MYLLLAQSEEVYKGMRARLGEVVFKHQASAIYFYVYFTLSMNMNFSFLKIRINECYDKCYMVLISKVLPSKVLLSKVLPAMYF